MLGLYSYNKLHQIFQSLHSLTSKAAMCFWLYSLSQFSTALILPATTFKFFPPPFFGANDMLNFCVGHVNTIGSTVDCLCTKYGHNMWPHSLVKCIFKLIKVSLGIWQYLIRCHATTFKCYPKCFIFLSIQDARITNFTYCVFLFFSAIVSHCAISCSFLC